MPNRAAVVIGINYDTLPPGVQPDATKSAGINRLHYAEADAQDVAALLTEAGYAVKLLTGVAATQRAIINTIIQQRRTAGPDGFLLIHFSGHGDVDPDDPQTAYLLPADTDPDALAASGIALDYLVQRYLSGVKSALALLDCCHSGYALGWKSGGGSERGRAFLAQAEATFNQAHGRVVLAACAGAARTRELGELAHGAFTYYFLDHWRNYIDEVTADSLFVNIDKALERRGLPRPVRGGTQEGRLVLRAPATGSSGTQEERLVLRAPTTRSISQVSHAHHTGDAEQRQKLYSDISMLNETGWNALLDTLGVTAGDLTGTTHPAKILNLISDMETERLLGVLEWAVHQVKFIPQITDSLVQLNIAESKNDWDRMINLGEPILKVIAEHEPTRTKIAKAYDKRSLHYHIQGDYASAIAAETRAIELAPKEAAYYWQRGISYHHKGDHDLAIADFNRAIELAPRVAAYYWHRGMSYEHKGDHNRAIADFNQAIKLARQVAAYYSSRGMSYHAIHDYDSAITDKTRAIELAILQAAYHYSRGLTYHAKGDYDRAITDFNQAINLTPQEGEYYWERAKSHYAKGDYDSAITDLTQAIELAPMVGKYYYDRALSYKAKGNYLAAREHIDQTSSYKVKGNYQAARQDLHRAVALGYTQAQQELANV